MVAGASYDSGDNNDGGVDIDDRCSANVDDGLSKSIVMIIQVIMFFIVKVKMTLIVVMNELRVLQCSLM